MTTVAAHAVRMLIAFVMTPVMLGYLGRNGYGTWSLVVGLVAFTSFAYMGIGGALNRHVAAAAAESDHRRLRGLTSSALVIHLGLGLACFGLFVLPWPWLYRWLLADAPVGRDALFWTYLALLGGFVCAIAGTTWSSFLSGLQREGIRNGVVLLSRVVMAGLGWLLLWRGWGVLGLGLAALVGEVVRLVGLAAAAWVVHPASRPRLALVERAELRRLLGFSLQLFSAGVAIVVFVQVDKIILNEFVDKAAVAVYAVISQLCLQLRNVPLLMMHPTLAAMSDLQALGDRARLKRLLDRTHAYGAAVAVLLFGGTVVLGPSFLELWVGDQVGPSMPLAAWGVRLLAVGHGLSALSLAAQNLAVAVHRPHLLRNGNGIAAALNLVGSLGLVVLLGFRGVIIASAVSLACGGAWLVVVLHRREVDLGLLSSLVRSLVAPVVGFAAATVVVVLAGWAVPRLTWMSWVAGGILFTGVYAAGCLLADRSLARTVLSMVKKAG